MTQQPMPRSPAADVTNLAQLPPPEEINVQLAPGMPNMLRVLTLAQLLEAAGLVSGVTDKFEEVWGQLTGLQTHIDERDNDLQRQIDELRSAAGLQAQAPAAAPAPGRPVPPRR